MSAISYEVSTYNKKYSISKLFFWDIRKYCKLFSNFMLVKSTLIVSHGKALSFYSLLEKKWLTQLFFEEEVIVLIRNGTSAECTAVLGNNILIVVTKHDKKENSMINDE